MKDSELVVETDRYRKIGLRDLASGARMLLMESTDGLEQEMKSRLTKADAATLAAALVAPRPLVVGDDIFAESRCSYRREVVEIGAEYVVTKDSDDGVISGYTIERAIELRDGR